MRIYSHFVSGHLINQYLIVNDENKEAVMIDAPDLDGNMIEIIEKNHFTLKALLITHSHEAHIKSLGTIYKIYNPTLYAYFEEIGYDVSIIVSKWFITLFAYVPCSPLSSR